MNLFKWSWIITKLFIILMIPTLIYLWIAQSIFTSHLKKTVTNDPNAGLTRSVSALKISIDEEYQILLSQINHTTDKNWIQKDLINPNMTLSEYHQIGGQLAGFLQRPLFIWANKNGGVLFNTIGLPPEVPAPHASPTMVPLRSRHKSGKKIHFHHKTQPILYSVQHWPGFDQAYDKNTEMGLTTYKNRYYLSVCAPFIRREKIIGAMLLGLKLDPSVLERIKSITQNEVAFYANNQIQSSTFPNSALSDLEKTPYAPRHSVVTINHQDFLWEDIPIHDLDQEVAGHFFIFQPIQESITVAGSPERSLFHLGMVFVGIMVILGLWYAWDLLYPLRHITRQVDLIKEGHFSASLPVKRHDDWGNLARSIQGLIQSLKDKEHISLVLGKVLSPQITQKILAEKNYFAIKGERRECTLLQAQIKGFNTLSQNMMPEVLVEVLNSYLSLIHELVFKYDGMLDKFVGDTAIAVWGVPTTCEDKELKAVQTALEIQDAVKELNLVRIQKGHPPFSLGIGIHTGTLVSGNLGSDQQYDYSIIGQPLQTVDQMCAMAAPGQILLSEETYEKLKDLISVSPASPIAIPGGKQPIQTYLINQFF